jgi:hypothetical protein
LPNGFLTILEAADLLSQTMHAGIPDAPAVMQLRKDGFDVADRTARTLAIGEIWRAVDEGWLRAFAIGGQPRRIIKLPPDFTRSVPALRSARGRGFTMLRQSNPSYGQLASWFGPSLHTAILAFRETEVQKLARRLMRARRGAQRVGSRESRRGRPSRVKIVEPVICDLVTRGKWNPTMGMKALTREVNRVGRWPKLASPDTVTRALDSLHEQTRDRRFERVRHRRRARQKGGR